MNDTFDHNFRNVPGDQQGIIYFKGIIVQCDGGLAQEYFKKGAFRFLQANYSYFF